VVIQEDVQRSGDTVTLQANLDVARHVRPLGQDFRKGDSLAPRRLRPADLALLAAMNLPEVTASHRPVVALIATGDELVMPGEVPGPDQIVASNTFALKAMVEQAGGIGRLLPIARDNDAHLRQVFALAEGADLIVTIGGASVGDHDLVGKVAQELGLERAFYKIAMRPGKPLMAGRLLGVPMLGLPGNPVSSFVCAHLFLVPLLRAMQGEPAVPAPARRAILATDTPATGPRTHYMRATLSDGPGLPRITPVDRQDSALISVLGGADALLIRPMGDGPQKTGTEVWYHPI